ncbi:protein-methionine-sulfoxide reductase catalytic subunit MsrP [Methylobacillus gramineus]|uniref:protein-methionine-sulfoxide reductase catalytic subunit MsrP n=1 Tax=Methylobacillus gramineus TaxID=755169 RepID=UPI001CFF8719|nr:protein-methionine-sulfoxide reductase catalytic subunit MsrP [Methylobacillus gramineus]MCB5184293.1 protein-methionine-sulfoxide reductase catalytic subunit MsrP [Methylobacillus gramineus]
MLIGKPSDINPSDITPQEIFHRRRDIIKAAGLGAIILANGGLNPAALAAEIAHKPKIPGFRKTTYGDSEKLTPYEDVTTYNNFYEFGTSKENPAANSALFNPSPWSISIEGEVSKPRKISLEELLKLAPLEERIYRMRCVEGWSMVIPWVGLPLSALIKWAEPHGNAKFIEFISMADPNTMPGVRAPLLDWPYLEGLRIDEAMNPLTILAVGLYGEQLQNQNGAPVRLVVPWKYGFKGGKSLVRIRFVEKMPQTTWMRAGPKEYGFYANVNPEVEHPRWSQASERRIGGGLFSRRVPTQMFNGYAEQVGQLYSGMDLRKHF